MTEMQAIDRKITLEHQTINGLTADIVKHCAAVAKLEEKRKEILIKELEAKKNG